MTDQPAVPEPPLETLTDCPACLRETQHTDFWSATAQVASRVGRTSLEMARSYLKMFHANGHPCSDPPPGDHH